MSTQSQQTGQHTPRPDLPVQRLPRSARGLWQVVTSWTVGTAVAVVVVVSTPVNATYGVLLGWDVGTIAYLVWTWDINRRLDSEETAEAAVREDPTRPVRNIILLVAAVASLVAVIYTIADASGTSGAARTVRVTFGVASIACSWLLVHTIFTTMYARAYYIDEDGGIDFNMDEPPVWTDFAYLAFAIGMTFQVSDTELQSSALRRLVLRQALISYLFGAVIIAITINLIAGLTQ